MQRRVGDAKRTVEHTEAFDQMVVVGVEHLGCDHGVQRTRSVAKLRRRRRARESFDYLVVGGNYLGTVARVELEAVVLGRVVAGGDHDARTRAERLHGVGDQRRRQRPRHLVHPYAGAEQDRDNLVVEGLRAVAGVTPRDGSTPSSSSHATTPWVARRTV